MDAVEPLSDSANPDVVMGAEPFNDLFHRRKFHSLGAVAAQPPYLLIIPCYGGGEA